MNNIYNEDNYIIMFNSQPKVLSFYFICKPVIRNTMTNNRIPKIEQFINFENKAKSMQTSCKLMLLIDIYDQYFHRYSWSIRESIQNLNTLESIRIRIRILCFWYSNTFEYRIRIPHAWYAQRPLLKGLIKHIYWNYLKLCYSFA
jgi:hypothetical protein